MTTPPREIRMLLVVTTPGTEAEQVLPPGRDKPPWVIHVAQPWKPIVCGCGEQHAAEDGEFLTLLVGQPHAEARMNRETFTMAVVPNLNVPPCDGWPYVAPEPDSGLFEVWTSRLVAHFSDFFSAPICMCTRWDKIRIFWDPAHELLGCGQERDPSQEDVPICPPEYSRLRFAAEPAADSLVNAMARLLDRSNWITPACHRVMVTLSIDEKQGLLSDANEAWGLLDERTQEQTKILGHMPVVPAGSVPILSVLGG